MSSAVNTATLVMLLLMIACVCVFALVWLANTVRMAWNFFHRRGFQ